MRRFPTELVKSAMIDGAGFFQIFWRILLPNSGADLHRDGDLSVLPTSGMIFCSARPSPPAISRR